MSTTVDTQTKSALIERVVTTSATLTATAEQAESLAEGFESTFTTFLAEFNEALSVANEATIRKALQADGKASGVKHFAASAAGCSLISSVGAVYALDGDLPETFVWRPDNKGAVGIHDGERSVHSLVRKVTDIGGKDAIKKCISEAEGTKTGFITAAVAVVAEAERIAREEKAAERGPKSAEKLLRAASGPIAKAATEDAPIEDIAVVEELIAAIRASLADVEGRVSAIRTAAAEAAAE